MTPPPPPAVTAVAQRGATVRCRGVSQVYPLDGEEVHALREVDIDVAAGEVVARRTM